LPLASRNDFASLFKLRIGDEAMDRFSDRVVAGQGYASGGLGYAVSERGPDDASMARHAEALAELVKRADERLDGLRSLADFVAGGDPTANGASGPKPVPLGLGAEMRERITALENRLNAMAHEFGRLDRAIRG
jgi:hypothetical protein